MKKKTTKINLNKNDRLLIKKEIKEIKDIDKLFDNSDMNESLLDSISGISVIKKKKNFDFFSPNIKKLDSFYVFIRFKKL